MHTPLGCALMGWVPYPAHMGPRFAGPITALRAFKKKKNNTRMRMRLCVGTLRSNLGQIPLRIKCECAAMWGHLRE